MPDASAAESRRVRIVLFGVLRCFRCHKIWGADAHVSGGYDDRFLAVSRTIALSLSPKTEAGVRYKPALYEIPF